jgi:ArsR family transcriptional regulator
MSPELSASTPDTLLLQRFQAVAEETRLSIVRLLSSGERCVCELQTELDAAQSRLSFHLKKLKDAGVVQDRRDGRWVYYRLVPEALEEMRSVLGDLGTSGEEAWSGGGGGGCCG